MGVCVPHAQGYAALEQVAVGKMKHAHSLVVQEHLDLSVGYRCLKIVPLCGGALYGHIHNV